MNEQTVAALSRRAAASMSRRGSLLSLGGALAAVLAAPPLAQAKNAKQGKKKAKRKAAQRAENEANQICQSQIAVCRSHILSLCQEGSGECFAAAECCSSLGACDVAGFLACVVAAT